MIFVYYRLIVENVGVNILKTVAVIGGGITGLTTLYYLQKLKRERNLPLKLLLLEKNSHLGGKINTREAGNLSWKQGRFYRSSKRERHASARRAILNKRFSI